MLTLSIPHGRGQRGGQVLDELFLGDAARRLATGLGLLLLAAIAALAAIRQARRSGSPWIPQRGPLGITLAVTPVAIGIIFSAVWGGIGAVVFAIVAMAISGLVALLHFVRST